MKKLLYWVLFLICVIPTTVHAQRGCCSRHGGVVGCSETGRQVCADGTLSPSCTCTPPPVYGCTNKKAINYNPKATKDDGSCKLKVAGCTDKKAANYNAKANTDDNSCQYKTNSTEKETIPYQTVQKENEEMFVGEERKIQEGINGEKEITYEIISDSSGNIIKKTLSSEKETVKAQDEIVEIGTKEKETPNEDNTSKKEDNSKNNFITNIEEENEENQISETETSSSIPSILWIISIIFVAFYKKKNNHLLWTKISNISHGKKIKIILYILYFFLIIPVFIDAILCLIDIFKKRLWKN